MDQTTTTYTLPAKLYHDNAFFKTERVKIFFNEWQWVGRSELVKNPGQFITAEIANSPIVIIRDNKNKLRAFHNVCRHRASKILLDKKGNCKKSCLSISWMALWIGWKAPELPKFFWR